MRLVWLFVVLAVVFSLPTLVGQIRYAYTYNTQKAKSNAASERLGELKPQLDTLSEAFRLVALDVGPSVVHIRSGRRTIRGDASDERNLLFGKPDANQHPQGQGSGVIVSAEGYIVTNNHVVEGSNSIDVQLADGRTFAAEVVGTDPLTDIAVLKIDAGNELIRATWGDSSHLEVGDMVWAVGSPFGLQRSITFGILSARDRRGLARTMYHDFLQTDAAVNPGNSGGPLVNLEGQVVGINTAIVGASYQGISFAIPSNTARDVYERLRRSGKVVRGWLGVGLAAIDEQDAKVLGLEHAIGVAVTRVVANSPADAAGLKRGDVILAWNGEAVADPTTLSRLVAATPSGTEAEVEFARQGSTIRSTVVVGERSF